ncbi:QRFP-like peptide receptor [Periplaneta americana]|uniref:QRFP-like peptide receptor n=1 Tax=Periplaneta americana TaxID=6978 RepID=UPI0037E7F8BC
MSEDDPQIDNAIITPCFSVTNYFLVNLSVADLLVTVICMPVAISQAVIKLWLYGEFMCKVTYYLQGVSVGASVFTITAMSIDRYLAIRHPMAFRKIFNRTTTLFVIVVLWIVALSIFAPLIWVRQVEVPDIDPDLNLPGFCIEKWPDSHERLMYGVLCFVLVYAVPGSVVVLAYSLMGLRLCAISPPFNGPGNEAMASTQQCTRLVRERRRVARILLLLAVLFAFCWLPYNVLALLFDLGVNKNIQLFSFFLLLGHANSAINPILYCFMTRNFRRAVRELVLRSRVSLANRQHQRCNIRAPLRSATTSSGYDSYHSPHRRCYMLHTMRRAAAEDQDVSTAQSLNPRVAPDQYYHYHHHHYHHHQHQRGGTTSTRASTLTDSNRYL